MHPWCRSLMIALANEDETMMETLALSVPAFETLDDARQARQLVDEALRFLTRRKNDIREIMQKMQKARNYQTSYQRLSNGRFDNVSL